MSDFSNQPQGYVPPTMGYMPPEDPYALRVGFGKRFGAVLIDILIIGVIGGAIGYTMQDFFIGMMPPPSGMEGLDESTVAMAQGAGGISLAISLFALLYSFVEMLTGASPAKHILGIIVAHDDRRAGDTALYIKRWFIKSIPSLVSLLGTLTAIGVISTLGMILSLALLVGCFFALGEKKQALHDMLAKTAVFHKADVISANNPVVQAV